MPPRVREAIDPARVGPAPAPRHAQSPRAAVGAVALEDDLMSAIDARLEWLAKPRGVDGVLATFACGPCDRTTPHPGAATLVRWLEDLAEAAEALRPTDGRVVDLSVRVLRTEIDRMVRFERTRILCAAERAPKAAPGQPEAQA